MKTTHKRLENEELPSKEQYVAMCLRRLGKLEPDVVRTARYVFELAYDAGFFPADALRFAKTFEEIDPDLDEDTAFQRRSTIQNQYDAPVKESFQVSESTIRRIIDEELVALREHVDHDGAKMVVTASSKLLKACLAFKESELTPPMQNAMVPDLDKVISTLEKMINSPTSYTVQVQPKKAPKKKVVRLSSK